MVSSIYLSIDTVPTPAAFYKSCKDANYAIWPPPPPALNQIRHVNIKDIMFRLL